VIVTLLLLESVKLNFEGADNAGRNKVVCEATSMWLEILIRGHKVCSVFKLLKIP